jgi:hypothetical protein
MKTVPDGDEPTFGLGKPIRKAPPPPADKIEALGNGIYRVNGKLETSRPLPPSPPPVIDWQAVADAIDRMHGEVDIIVLDNGVLQVKRDPNFPREEWGSF